MCGSRSSYPTSDTIHYTQDHGDALYRRSMYTYWKRMATMPDMDAFDAPMRDAVCTRRQRTDTPLQALVTMNDVQWVEASRALAQRVISDGREAAATAHQADERYSAVARSACRDGVRAGELAARRWRSTTRRIPRRRMSWSSVGEKKTDPSIPAAELAAWTMVASEMLNLDETVTK